MSAKPVATRRSCVRSSQTVSGAAVIVGEAEQSIVLHRENGLLSRKSSPQSRGQAAASEPSDDPAGRVKFEF